MSEIIEIGEQLRIRVEPDEGSPNPREGWDFMRTGFVKIDGRGDSRLTDVPAVHEPWVDLRHVHETFADDWTTDGTGYLRRKHVAEDLVARWALIFHDRVVEYDAQHGGYWFVHMDEDFSADRTGQREIIAEERELYQQWADGHASMVILERAVQYAKVEWNLASEVWDLVNPLTDDDVRTEWESIDRVGEQYLDENFTVWSLVATYWQDELDSEQWDVVQAHLPAASPLAGEGVIP